MKTDTEFEEKLKRENADAISRLAQCSQEREHNAYQALMWRDIAERLAKALKRTNWQECGELDHSGGHYHEGPECSVVKLITEALASFEEAKK